MVDNLEVELLEFFKLTGDLSLRVLHAIQPCQGSMHAPYGAENGVPEGRGESESRMPQQFFSRSTIVTFSFGQEATSICNYTLPPVAIKL